MEAENIVLFVCIGLGMFAVIGGLAMLSNYYTLNGIKSRTVGDGQHGTARFATEKEIRETYTHVSYEPEKWRHGEALPTKQGLVVGYKKKGNSMKITIANNPISMIIHVKNIPNKVKLCETAMPECDKIILIITASPSTPEP